MGREGKGLFFKATTEFGAWDTKPPESKKKESYQSSTVSGILEAISFLNYVTPIQPESSPPPVLLQNDKRKLNLQFVSSRNVSL